MDLALSLRHVNGGLAGGIASADDDNVVVAAELGFHEGGAVIDALSFEKGEISDARFVVLRAGGDDDRARGQFDAVIEHDFVGAAGAFEAHHVAGDHHLGAEFFGLGDGSIGEFLAGKAVGKTEIVFDFGAGGGLSAGRFGLDKKDVETFGGGVNGGGESRGTGADNDEVAELRGVNVGVEAEAVGEFLNCGIAEDIALAADYDGNFVNLDVEAIEEFL